MSFEPENNNGAGHTAENILLFEREKAEFAISGWPSLESTLTLPPHPPGRITCGYHAIWPIRLPGGAINSTLLCSQKMSLHSPRLFEEVLIV
jgi:hypothetical protein